MSCDPTFPSLAMQADASSQSPQWEPSSCPMLTVLDRLIGQEVNGKAGTSSAFGATSPTETSAVPPKQMMPTTSLAGSAGVALRSLRSCAHEAPPTYVPIPLPRGPKPGRRPPSMRRLRRASESLEECGRGLENGITRSKHFWSAPSFSVPQRVEKPLHSGRASINPRMFKNIAMRSLKEAADIDDEEDATLDEKALLSEPETVDGKPGTDMPGDSEDEIETDQDSGPQYL
mmetsp:Transcript_106682/g.227808  ORF Transcript_106682/g.227808 Transcript_106682/m.227808 type:complete len:231 (+) Transcript_106682:1-693(+)